MKQTQKFMNPKLFLPVVLTGLLIAGCSSTPTRVDKGPVKARIFSLINRGNAATADFAVSREQVHGIIPLLT